jgi:hypothetical protein
VGEPVLLLRGYRAFEEIEVSGGNQADEEHVVVVDARDFDVLVRMKNPGELLAMVHVDDGICCSVYDEQRA